MRQLLGIKDEDEQQQQREKTAYVKLNRSSALLLLTNTAICLSGKSRVFHSTSQSLTNLNSTVISFPSRLPTWVTLVGSDTTLPTIFRHASTALLKLF
jgi:hypothetical protein